MSGMWSLFSKQPFDQFLYFCAKRGILQDFVGHVFGNVIRGVAHGLGHTGSLPLTIMGLQ
jgi:hypothetical protein